MMSAEAGNSLGKGISRRSAIRSGLILGTSLAARPIAAFAQAGSTENDPLKATVPQKARAISFTLNSQPFEIKAASRTTLLDLLREDVGLSGTKKGCDHGQCGACTVLVNGRRVLSCLTLAVTLDHKEVVTIEGLGQADDLHPLQTSFIKHDAFQCGFCTPGQLMSAAGFLKEPWPTTTDAIREGMSGNLCRCGAYCGIIAAIDDIRKNLPPTTI